MLRRLPNPTLDPAPLIWRENLGLRGLAALPVTFGQASPDAHSESSFLKPSSPAGREGDLVPGRVPLSEAKRKLLEKYLRGERAQTPAESITRRPPAEPAPLSSTQQQLWLRETSVPGIPPLYNESITLNMAGPLDVVVFEESLSEIVRRHEIWRTTVDTVNGEPVQIIHTASSIKLPVVDLRGIPKAERETEVVRRVTADARRPFDLSRGPLLRPTLVRLDDTEHRLFLIAHQMVLDGISVYQIFPFELAILYKAFCEGKRSPLPDLSVQYADFAYWQRQWLKGDVLAKQVNYWRNQLRGRPPVLQWPCDRPRPVVQTFKGAIRPFAMPRRLTEELRQLIRRESCTLFMVLLAGFASLLHRYTRQADIVVGTLAPAGRKRTEVLGLLGYFLNPVALRFNFDSRPTFSQILQQARTVTSEAISQDDVPIECLARELNLKIDLSRSPFFTVAVSLQPRQPDLDFAWSVTSMDVESGGANWDLYIAFIEGPNGLTGRAQYNPDLFEPTTITAVLEDLQLLLGVAAVDPLQLVQDLPLPKLP